MVKQNLSISVKRDIIKTLKNFYGIKLTQKQLDKFLTQKIIKEIKEYGFVTSTRENLLNHISLKVCKLRWPIYGDTKSYKKMHTFEFQQGCTRNNIDLDTSNSYFNRFIAEFR